MAARQGKSVDAFLASMSAWEFDELFQAFLLVGFGDWPALATQTAYTSDRLKKGTKPKDILRTMVAVFLEARPRPIQSIDQQQAFCKAAMAVFGGVFTEGS